MKIGFSLMMHPKRLDYLPYIKSVLGDIPVSLDDDNNIWTTCKKAWQLHDPDCEYWGVIQDDLIFTENFIEKVNKLVEGDYVYSLYLGNRRKFNKSVNWAKKTKAKWIERSHIYHECALIFPTHRINPMLKFCEHFNPNDDKIINKYVNSEGLTVRISMPSLVNHRQIPSLHTDNKSAFHTRTAIYFEP